MSNQPEFAIAGEVYVGIDQAQVLLSHAGSTLLAGSYSYRVYDTEGGIAATGPAGLVLTQPEGSGGPYAFSVTNLTADTDYGCVKLFNSEGAQVGTQSNAFRTLPAVAFISVSKSLINGVFTFIVTSAETQGATYTLPTTVSFYSPSTGNGYDGEWTFTPSGATGIIATGQIPAGNLTNDISFVPKWTSPYGMSVYGTSELMSLVHITGVDMGDGYIAVTIYNGNVLSNQPLSIKNVAGDTVRTVTVDNSPYNTSIIDVATGRNTFKLYDSTNAYLDVFSVDVARYVTGMTATVSGYTVTVAWGNTGATDTVIVELSDGEGSTTIYEGTGSSTTLLLQAGTYTVTAFYQGVSASYGDSSTFTVSDFTYTAPSSITLSNTALEVTNANSLVSGYHFTMTKDGITFMELTSFIGSSYTFNTPLEAGTYEVSVVAFYGDATWNKVSDPALVVTAYLVEPVGTITYDNGTLSWEPINNSNLIYSFEYQDAEISSVNGELSEGASAMNIPETLAYGNWTFYLTNSVGETSVSNNVSFLREENVVPSVQQFDSTSIAVDYSSLHSGLLPIKVYVDGNYQTEVTAGVAKEIYTVGAGSTGHTVGFNYSSNLYTSLAESAPVSVSMASDFRVTSISGTYDSSTNMYTVNIGVTGIVDRIVTQGTASETKKAWSAGNTTITTYTTGLSGRVFTNTYYTSCPGIYELTATPFSGLMSGGQDSKWLFVPASASSFTVNDYTVSWILNKSQYCDSLTLYSVDTNGDRTPIMSGITVGTTSVNLYLPSGDYNITLGVGYKGQTYYYPDPQPYHSSLVKPGNVSFNVDVGTTTTISWSPDGEYSYDVGGTTGSVETASLAIPYASGAVQFSVWPLGSSLSSLKLTGGTYTILPSSSLTAGVSGGTYIESFAVGTADGTRWIEKSGVTVSGSNGTRTGGTVTAMTVGLTAGCSYVMAYSFSTASASYVYRTPFYAPRSVSSASYANGSVSWTSTGHTGATVIISEGATVLACASMTAGSVAVSPLSGSGTLKIVTKVGSNTSAAYSFNYNMSSVSGLTATVTGANVALTWSKIGSASSYAVTYSGGSSGTTSTSGTSITLTGLRAGEYTVTVAPNTNVEGGAASAQFVVNVARIDTVAFSGVSGKVNCVVTVAEGHADAVIFTLMQGKKSVGKFEMSVQDGVAKFYNLPVTDSQVMANVQARSGNQTGAVRAVGVAAPSRAVNLKIRGEDLSWKAIGKSLVQIGDGEPILLNKTTLNLRSVTEPTVITITPVSKDGIRGVPQSIEYVPQNLARSSRDVELVEAPTTSIVMAGNTAIITWDTSASGISTVTISSTSLSAVVPYSDGTYQGKVTGDQAITVSFGEVETVVYAKVPRGSMLLWAGLLVVIILLVLAWFMRK